MEKKIIELILIAVCGLILARGVLFPLGKLVMPTFSWLLRLVFPLLEKSPMEKQQEALKEARERVRIAEIQKETIQTEKKAMRIQNSIIDEEFEELDESSKKSWSK